MNWIPFDKQRPKEEPLRDILVLHSSGRYGIWTSSLPQSWTANSMTHWAEIEGPEKACTIMKYRIWSNEHIAWWKADELGYTKSSSEAGFYPIERAIEICLRANIALRAGCIPNEAIVPVDDELELPPKPDPFEEWPNSPEYRSILSAVVDALTPLDGPARKRVLDAAMKHKEGK